MSHILIRYPAALAEGQFYTIRPEDEAHFLATMQRAMTMGTGDGPKVESVEIFLRDRTQPRSTAGGQVFDEGGWLEHTIVIKYEGGRQMVIGAIQRTVGAHSEFHS